MKQENYPITNTAGLGIVGKVSKKTLQQFSTAHALDFDIALFAAHADVDIPVHHVFSHLKTSGEELVPFVANLVGVTQQYDKPFDGVPKGWKTIIFLKVQDEVPESLKQLPNFEDWESYDIQCFLLPVVENS